MTETKKARAGRPAKDRFDRATIRKTWNARPSDLARLERLKAVRGLSEGALIREALELLETSGA